MNTHIKILRNACIALISASAGLSSAALASDVEAVADADLINATELAMTEVMIDAARSFEKVDRNADGLIDVEEFTSQRVVRAQLARFTRSIPVEGVTTVRVALPTSISNRLTESERAALETVTRNDFALRTSGGEGLTQAQWQDARLETFALADMDGSGTLEGEELVSFVQALAGSIAIGQLGS